MRSALGCPRLGAQRALTARCQLCPWAGGSCMALAEPRQRSQAGAASRGGGSGFAGEQGVKASQPVPIPGLSNATSKPQLKVQGMPQAPSSAKCWFYCWALGAGDLPEQLLSLLIPHFGGSLFRKTRAKHCTTLGRAAAKSQQMEWSLQREPAAAPDPAPACPPSKIQLHFFSACSWPDEENIRGVRGFCKGLL